MGLCPPKKGILAETSGWNKLVDKLRKKYGENAEKIAEYAFFSKGDMPTFEEAEALLSKGEKKSLGNTVKAGIDKMFKEFRLKDKELFGYGFGIAEGRLAGEMFGKRVGREQGKKEGSKEREAEIKQYQQEMSDRLKLYLETNEQLVGKLGAKKINSIVKKANELGYNEAKFVKLTEYIDKVIANENYDQDLSTAESLKGKLKDYFADAKKVIEKMKGFDLEGLTQKELLDFSYVANKFVKSGKQPNSALYEPFNVAEAEAIVATIEKGINDRLIENLKEAYGIENISPEEANFIDEYMNAEDKDVFENNLSDAKKKKLRDELVRIAEYSLVGLEDKMSISRIEFEEKYGKEFVDRIDEILSIDIRDIENTKQIAEITKIIDNIIINGTNSNIGKASSIVRANIGIGKIAKFTNPILKFIAGSTSKATYSTGMIFKRIFGDKIAAAAFRTFSRLDDVYAASGNMEIALVAEKKLWDAYRKKNKIDNDAKTDVITNVFARLNNVGFDLVKQPNELPEPTKQELQEDIKNGNVTLVEYDSVAEVPQALLDLKIGFIEVTKNKNILGIEYLSKKFSKSKTTVSLRVPNSFLRYAESLPKKVGRLDDFLNEKSLLETTIDRYAKSDIPEENELGQFLAEIYDEIVRDSKTHQEFVDKFRSVYKKEADAADWVSKNIWGKLKPQLKKHSEENLNTYFEGDNQIGYHPRSYVRIGSTSKAVGPGEGRTRDAGINPRETGRTLERTNKGAIEKGKVVDYRFEYNTFKTYKQVKFELESYEAAQTFAYMSELDGFNDILGGSQNAEFVKKMYNSQYLAFRDGRIMSDELAKSMVMQILRDVRNIGTALVLGRPTQVLSQSTPILNAIVQTPKQLFKVIGKKGISEIPLFNYTIIGARGNQMGAMGRAEGTEAITYTKLRNKGRKAVDWASSATAKNRDRSLYLLGRTDNAIAKTSFLAYYLKYMNEIAKDAKGRKLPETTAEDLYTEHERMDETRKMALSYAQQSIDETQGSSSREMMSNWSKNSSGDATAEIAKTVAMPFNNFAMNSRTRIVEDLRKLRYGSKAQKKEAGIDLAGTFVESVGYASVQVFIVNGLYQYGLKKILSSMFGIDDGKDFHETMAGKFKTWYTNITKEMLFSGVGTAVENAGIDAANALVFTGLELRRMFYNETGQDFMKWLDDDPTFKRGYRPKEGVLPSIISNMGGYGIPIEVAKKSTEDISSYISGKGKAGYNWDKNEGTKVGPTGLEYTNTLKGSYETEIPLTEEERDYFLFLGLANGFSLVTGLTDQDIMRAGEKVKYDIQGSALKKVPSTKKSKTSKLSMGAMKTLTGMGKLK